MVALVLAGVPIAMLSLLGQFGALLVSQRDPVQALLLLDLGKQGTLIATIFWGL